MLYKLLKVLVFYYINIKMGTLRIGRFIFLWIEKDYFAALNNRLDLRQKSISFFRISFIWSQR